MCDLDRVAELCAAHAEYERISVDMAGLSQRMKQEVESSRRRFFILVAEIKHNIVAYASLTLEYSTWKGAEYLHMDCLFVEPERRGEQIGQQLFEEVLVLSKKLNVSEIQWQTPTWNQRAIKFYESLGALGSNKTRFHFLI